MDDAKKVKEMKQHVKDKADSQKTWETVAEPPRGKKEAAEYFNQSVKSRLLPLRTVSRWMAKLFGAN